MFQLYTHAYLFKVRCVFHYPELALLADLSLLFLPDRYSFPTSSNGGSGSRQRSLSSRISRLSSTQLDPIHRRILVFVVLHLQPSIHRVRRARSRDPRGGGGRGVRGSSPDSSSSFDPSRRRDRLYRSHSRMADRVVSTSSLRFPSVSSLRFRGGEEKNGAEGNRTLFRA